MKKTYFSIIIPAYNEENIIKKCIEKTKKQKTAIPYEVIVVDNNSTDKTKDIAKTEGAKVINEKIQGVGAARRKGTEEAKGKIIVHIDADTVITPTHLEKIYKNFKENEKLVCLGGIFLFYDAPVWKNILRKILYKPLLFLAKITSKKTIGPMGNNMAFKKCAYEKTKGFDKRLKFGEDIEICRELKKHGEIKIDQSLKVGISSRRYTINKKFLTYTLNFVSSCIRKKPYKNVLPSFENESKNLL